MPTFRSRLALVALTIALAFAENPPSSQAQESPAGSWPNKIPRNWESIDDIPLKNVGGVKAIKLKLKISRRDYDPKTKEVKSLWGSLIYQNVFDDTKSGWALWALDDHQKRFDVPELIVEGMKAKAVEEFSLFRKNTRTTILRPNKPIPDELILTITDSNPKANRSIITVKDIRFRPSK